MAEPSAGGDEAQMEVSSKSLIGVGNSGGGSGRRSDLSVKIPLTGSESSEYHDGPAPPPPELLHAASVPDLATQMALAEEGRNPLAPQAVQEHIKKKLSSARTAPAAYLEDAMDDPRWSSMLISPIVMQPSAPATPVQVPEINWPGGKKPHPIKLKPEPSPLASPDPSPPPSPKRRLRDAVMGKGPSSHQDSDSDLPKLEDVAVS